MTNQIIRHYLFLITYFISKYIEFEQYEIFICVYLRNLRSQSLDEKCPLIILIIILLHMNEFSHIDENGKASMVDVSDKPIQKRTALAKGFIQLEAATIQKIRTNELKKGDVLTVAQIAGIQAAKATASLIPLCHTLMISKVKVDFEILENGVEARCTTVCSGQTGIEMEALTGVSVALLTIYDMCKAVDKNMEISGIRLISKTKE